MKQIALSFVVIGIFGIYAVLDRQQVKLQTPTNSIPQSTTKPRRLFGDDEGEGRRIVAPVATPISTAPPTTTVTKYKNGQYTGQAADALYGNLQVKAVISGGRILDVIFLDYPHDKQTSREINGQAMPILKSEAISAQVAQVDIVSGATQTSEAFVQSLQSALDQAKI